MFEKENRGNKEIQYKPNKECTNLVNATTTKKATLKTPSDSS